MPFSKNFLFKLEAKEKSEIDINKFFDDIKKRLDRVVENAASRSGAFLPKMIKIYQQGSILNEVNVGNSAKFEVVFELTKLIQEDFEEFYFAPITKKRAVKIAPSYGIGDFKTDLHNAFLDEFPQNNVRRTNHSITLDVGGDVLIAMEILPAFSFKKKNINDEIVDCLLVYEEFANKFVTSYPSLHTANLAKKDKETNGNTKIVIRAIKRLRDYLAKHFEFNAKVAPGYFIDCLVYNVPNVLFTGETTNDIILKVLNFLNVKHLNEMLCVHEQFEMFGTAFDQWNIKNARAFINALIYLYDNINE